MKSLLALPLPSTSHQFVHWGDVQSSPLAFALANLAFETSKPIIVLTESSQMANQLARELPVFLNGSKPILQFPDWETLPYDHFSPHQDIVSLRLLTLNRLPRMTDGVMVVPVSTLMNKIAPPSYLHRYTVAFKVGDKLSIEKLRLQLVNSGYYHVSAVMEHGEFSVRGSIVDLFPMGMDNPIRIDLFDDEIETLRYFDPSTQRSTDKVDEILMLPAREYPLDEESITRFRKNWRAKFEGDASKSPVYLNVSQGTGAGGIEYYLPLFFEDLSTTSTEELLESSHHDSSASLIDYFPSDALLVRVGDVVQAANTYWHEIEERYEQHRYDLQRPLLPPNQLFSPVNQLFSQLKPYQYIQTGADQERVLPLSALPDLTIEPKSDTPLTRLNGFIQSHPDYKILFCAESSGRQESLLELLGKAQIKPTLVSHLGEFLASPTAIAMCVAPLDQGFIITEHNTVIIAEALLYGQRVMQRRRRSKHQNRQSDSWLRDLAELEIGAPVVHIDHGIGRYLGLTHLNLSAIEAEYVTIGYASNDKLYVPVSSLHLISRYSGSDPDAAPMHRLGSDHWTKAKQHAAKKVQDVAAELLEIYARRAAKQGFMYQNPDESYYKFASAFPFEETPDQIDAINSIIEDMTSTKPMDRLVCGDVGFGKTEVAMRAVFLAVQTGKQVGVLVPTTLLAEQHFQTFSDRFSDWPVSIEVLSRFKSKKEQEQTLAKLESGLVDIVIGTHKLLQDDVKFKNLGLLVIDEEHRFGVKQKEKLKSLRAEVDILTLTATPIPRTLNMAMASIRDLSIIATPPARRLSVKTFVRNSTPALLREAIMRELLRGGQVYFVHNDVESINRKANELMEIVPEARIGVAHGQMPERELERVMMDFYHQRFNILLCTTIIETGIDIPSANTIIIDRADKFGLAQLHQLRGRVGRSHHQAYAFCLTPTHKKMTKDAERRLEALESLEELGSGFSLSTHDLEIRGAGELLGEDQSGDMQSIGFNLYMELLERSVKALQSGKAPVDLENYRPGAEIDLQIPALIPDTFIHDVHTRLVLYKRLCAARDQDELHELQVEMIDRFGMLPTQVINLIKVSELRIKAEPLGIHKIDVDETGGKIDFELKPNFDPDNIVQLMKAHPRMYRITGPSQLRFSLPMKEIELRFKTLHYILDKLSINNQNNKTAL